MADGPHGDAEPTAILDTEQAGAVAIRGGALRVAGYGVSVGLSVVAVAAMTRHLGARDYGRYSVVQSLLAIAAGLAEAGMMNVGIREYAVRSGADRDVMMANLQGIRVALGLTGVALALLFGLVAGYDGTMLAGVALTGAGVLLTAYQSTLAIPLSASLRWRAMTVLEIVRQAAQVALFLALVGAGAGLLPFFVVTIPVGLLILAVTIPLMRHAAPVLPAFDREQWRGLGRLVAPYAAAAAVSSVYVYVAAVIMQLVSSEQEVGYFAAAFRVFVVLGGVPLLVVGAVFPILARAARNDATRLAYATERLLATALIAGAWMALMTALLAKPGIDVVAGSHFGPSASALRIQAIAVFFTFLIIASSHVLISLAHYRRLVQLSASALVLSAILTLALAPSMGAHGGAIANVGGEGISAVLGIAFLLRAGRGLRMPWGTALRVAIASGLAGAIALVGLPAVAAAALATLIFGAALLALKAIPRELLDLVRIANSE